MKKRNMKRRINRIIALVGLLALVTGVALQAQNKKFEVRKVDFDKVKEITLNPKADFYYSKLLKSFSGTDTTMSLEVFRDLYYGYVFQEDYNPFRQSQYGTVVEQLYYKQPHSRQECDSIEKYANLSLADNMFDLDQMQYYIYVLKEKKKYARAAVEQFKLDNIIAAIMSSGKGTKDEPWVVISPLHEYNIVNFLGYIAVNHTEMGKGIDYIAVKKRGRSKTEGFYFDVSRMWQEAQRKFPDEITSIPGEEITEVIGDTTLDGDTLGDANDDDPDGDDEEDDEEGEEDDE